MINSHDINVQVCRPKSLVYDDFFQIHEITQDMWADGSSELIKCNECGHISWKKEIFGHLPNNIYKLKVAKLLDDKHLRCFHCKSTSINLIHPADKNIAIIKNRLLSAIESNVVIARNTNNEIVWYGEVYTDYFEKAILKELSPHYPNIPIPEIKKRVEKLLWMDASIITIFAAVGILKEYRSSILFAKLLYNFFQYADFQLMDKPWLMEIQKYNPVYKVFIWLWGKSLNETDPAFFESNLHASQDYNSTILLFQNSMEVFKKHFTGLKVREILQIR